MLERFYLLKSCTRKSLIDLNIDISFTEDELNFISIIISALLPVKLAVEALSAADCTLLKADVTLKFMLDELSAQNNTLTKELRDELISRIQERRTIYSDTMRFLHNPLEFRNIHLEDNYDLFKLHKPSLTKIIVSLIERLNMTNESELTTDSNESSDDVDEIVYVIPLTMKDRLQLTIKNQNKIKMSKLQ